jgi:hypothetical protein
MGADLGSAPSRDTSGRYIVSIADVFKVEPLIGPWNSAKALGELLIQGELNTLLFKRHQSLTSRLQLRPGLICSCDSYGTRFGDEY